MSALPSALPCAKEKPLMRRALPAALASTLALALAGSLPAVAGKATVTSSEGTSMVFEYEGTDLLRIDTAEDSYLVVRDNTLFVVSNAEGEPMVFNASSMMKAFAGTLQQAAPSAATSEVVSLEKTNRKETVAGIRGDVYELTVNDEGEVRTEEMVMSGDKRAMEFRDAMFTMARAVIAVMDKGTLKENQDLEARLADMELGVLRVGKEMVVTEISGDRIAAARFELPAEPMDMQGLGSMLGGALGESSGKEDAGGDAGIFSGIMGALSGKADRQADRTERQVEREVDKETDKAVDKGIKKAFGKLFGGS